MVADRLEPQERLAIATDRRRAGQARRQRPGQVAQAQQQAVIDAVDQQRRLGQDTTVGTDLDQALAIAVIGSFEAGPQADQRKRRPDPSP